MKTNNRHFPASIESKFAEYRVMIGQAFITTPESYASLGDIVSIPRNEAESYDHSPEWKYTQDPATGHIRTLEKPVWVTISDEDNNADYLKVNFTLEFEPVADRNIIRSFVGKTSDGRTVANNKLVDYLNRQESLAYRIYSKLQNFSERDLESMDDLDDVAVFVEAYLEGDELMVEADIEEFIIHEYGDIDSFLQRLEELKHERSVSFR